MASVSDFVAYTFQFERGRELFLGAERLYAEAYLINYIL